MLMGRLYQAPLLSRHPTYQLRPCPPPLNLLPPPERGSSGFASFTVKDRPPICVPFKAVMAPWASSGLDISTKPKPRDCPVNLSAITRADSTVPCAANKVVSCISVAAYGKPPTYSFFEPMRVPPSEMTLSGTRERLDGGRRGSKTRLRGGLEQVSDQILGGNNIGDGPNQFIIHARPAAIECRFKVSDPGTISNWYLRRRSYLMNV